MKQLSLWIFLLTIAGTSWAQTQSKQSKELIKKQIPFENQEDNLLVVKNVFGEVSVEGYNGSEILLEVEKSIYADTDEALSLGQQELTLEVLQESGRVVLHPNAPYINFNGKSLKFNWCRDNHEPDYEHLLNFKLKVPNHIQIDAGTVNNGEVTIKNMRGNSIKAENINGGITLEQVTGQTNIECINGNVDISYVTNPIDSSRYFSLNGDINVSYQNSLSANISFKSMNGEMFTDFDINKQYMRTNKTQGMRKGPKFKYEAKPVVQIGSGQVDFDFETLNGNVFIKKI